MPCPIAWCALTWEAFATLAAGGGAVAGATIIGLRQLKLSQQQIRVTEQQAAIAGRQADVASRQADILNHQVEVDRAKLRADLFERRLAVYAACKAYIRAAMSRTADFETTHEVSVELGIQLEQAQFLFAGEVRDQLRAAAEQADQLVGEREVLRELTAGVGRQQQMSDEASRRQQAAKVRDMSRGLRDHLRTLADRMGEEMKLYIPKRSCGGDQPAT